MKALTARDLVTKYNRTITEPTLQDVLVYILHYATNGAMSITYEVDSRAATLPTLLEELSQLGYVVTSKEISDTRSQLMISWEE